MNRDAPRLSTLARAAGLLAGALILAGSARGAERAAEPARNAGKPAAVAAKKGPRSSAAKPGPAPARLRKVAESLAASQQRTHFFMHYKDSVAKLHGISTHTMVVTEQVRAGYTDDGWQRALVVLLNFETSKPTGVLLLALRWDREKMTKEEVSLGMSLDGSFLRGFGCEGKIDAEGTYVRQTCLMKPMEPGEARERVVRRELDFWLEADRHRRQTPVGPEITFKPGKRR